MIAIKDSFDRDVIIVKDGKVAIGRFDDLCKKELDCIMKIYYNLTGDSSTHIKDFMSFDTDEDEFCS